MSISLFFANSYIHNLQILFFDVYTLDCYCLCCSVLGVDLFYEHHRISAEYEKIYIAANNAIYIDRQCSIPGQKCLHI